MLERFNLVGPKKEFAIKISECLKKRFEYELNSDIYAV